MSRAELLAAIRARPAEDVPRLMYADELEENGEGDLDAATVEFIRVSCDCRQKGRKDGPAMPQAAYPWLYRNWWRLVPSAVVLNCGWDDGSCLGQCPAFTRQGRVIFAAWRLAVTTPLLGIKLPVRDYSVRLYFLRGFAERVLMWSPASRDALAGPFAADQPFLPQPFKVSA